MQAELFEIFVMFMYYFLMSNQKFNLKESSYNTNTSLILIVLQTN